MTACYVLNMRLRKALQVKSMLRLLFTEWYIETKNQIRLFPNILFGMLNTALQSCKSGVCFYMRFDIDLIIINYY